MNDKDMSDHSDDARVGPREESDTTTKSDAGMTGDEGPQEAESATVPDPDDDDD